MKRVQSSLFSHLLLGCVALLALTTPAHAWWDAAWPVRKQLTVNTTPTGLPLGTPTGSTTVLLRLFDGNFQFALAKPDGSDLRILADDDKTLLPYHIEKWDSLLNEAFVWVKLSEVKPGAKTDLWLYYGNQGGSALRVEDAKATYDADTLLVYHFANDGAPADSSGNGNAAETSGILSQGALIGSGLRLTGGAGVKLPASPSLKRTAGQPLTWSAWVKPTNLAEKAVVYHWSDNSGSLLLGYVKGLPYIEVRSGGSVQSSAGTAGDPSALNVWKHLAIVGTDAATILYVNGTEFARLPVPVPALDGRAVLGSEANGTAGFTGEVDELSLARTARSEAWLKFATINQGGSNDAGKLLVLGDDEAGEKVEHNEVLEHLSLFGDIAKNMMFDGWVVIFFCGVMAVVTWYVAVVKVLYLNKIEKGSDEFMRQWKTVAADLTVLDHQNPESVKSLGGVAAAQAQAMMQKSPIYHIYHLGSEEISNRIKSKAGFNGLSGRTMEAIKATLDAGLTREVHRLNDGLVYVTISIAGGPYIGLLGTVVGVMITFAVIAKSGEVEVNSIAPGIASALLATVAGLIVAIPALFIYSYLANRIKNVTTNMQLFIDEFIAKMAEFYPHNESETRKPGSSSR